MALGGFLAGYSGNTRLACQQDLRQYAVWCHRQQIPLFDVRRTHIELFARWLEHRGRPSHDFPATLDGGGFYRYCAEEQLPTSNPAVNVRRPRSRDETTIRVLDRSELGAFLVVCLSIGDPSRWPRELRRRGARAAGDRVIKSATDH